MTARSWQQQANAQHILRYADVLLMYAEAVNEGGTPTAGTAAHAADLVRLRADPAASSLAGLPQDALRDSIRIELRKEFVYEGQRWFDLQRYGNLDSTMRAKQTEINTYYPGETIIHGAPAALYPIPQTEILTTPALTQNTGW
jgi:starch-binding outer membrane protein, SusD/RagB family